MDVGKIIDGINRMRRTELHSHHAGLQGTDFPDP